jgi:hypothetical protein
MIIKNKVENEAILSNVGEVGEFRIRNSAKAFSILSSGLYANKIRAIIREYSCNAVDSHVEANKHDVPFDVHLPSTLEPWFSVRDYGVGLDEDQVRNIFTTYFDSSKTTTDELIGGLGLGSKSAFSYSDNFTIVAVKNGIKRVFTAFINDQGVPSIAPMGQEQSNEPTGVEIRFAVEDSYDFRKFAEEAKHVYKHFKLRPVVSGVSDFKFIDPEYTDTNIIPGVHTSFRSSYNSVAIMGNIEYPIDVPRNADLAGLSHLLDCGLVIEFGIGELDIQASREGLSYIPETIEAIKNKLVALNSVLADKLVSDANNIKNIWERTQFLYTKSQAKLWHNAAISYIAKKNIPIKCKNGYSYLEGTKVSVSDLATKHNIVITAIQRNSYSNTFKTISPRREYDDTHKDIGQFYTFMMSKSEHFVVNNTKAGVVERTKYHVLNSKDNKLGKEIYILNKADKTKEMDIKGFFKAILNPPKNQIHNADTLIQKPRATSIGKNIAILKLEKRNCQGHINSDDMVWRDAGNIDKFDDNETYYYFELSGYQVVGPGATYDSKAFFKAIENSKIIKHTIFGVRKSDIATVKNKKNWVNINQYLTNHLTNIDEAFVKKMAKAASTYNSVMRNASTNIRFVIENSLYYRVFTVYNNIEAADKKMVDAINTLVSIYKVDFNHSASLNKMVAEINEVGKRYPLLEKLDRYFSGGKDVADYVNAMELLVAQNAGKEF